MQFAIHPDDEDIHVANERRLCELIGQLGGKLHTGRSRNDQVATDMRLWLLEECKEIESEMKGLVRLIVERAAQEQDILMPGYTHLQVNSTNLRDLRYARCLCISKARATNQMVSLPPIARILFPSRLGTPPTVVREDLRSAVGQRSACR